MKKNSPINELRKGLVKLFWLVLYIYIKRKRGVIQIKFHYIYRPEKKNKKSVNISYIYVCIHII